MPGYKKALPYIAATIGLGGIGTGVYFAFVDRVYQKPAPGSDFTSELEEFLKKLMQWLEGHMGGNHPGQPPSNPGTPDPSTLDSSMSQSSFSSSSHDNGTSAEHALAHVPVELWALIAVATMVIAVAYYYHSNQQQQTASPRLMGG
ncbi:MAG: hypothetical protein ACHQAX_08580 [Gammaproteobacteria bacterium]